MDRREFLKSAGVVAVAVAVAPVGSISDEVIEGQLDEGQLDYLNSLDCSFPLKVKSFPVTLELRDGKALVAREDLFAQMGDETTCKILFEAEKHLSFNHIDFLENDRVVRSDDIRTIRLATGDCLELTMPTVCCFPESDF